MRKKKEPKAKVVYNGRGYEDEHQRIDRPALTDLPFDRMTHGCYRIRRAPGLDDVGWDQ